MLELKVNNENTVPFKDDIDYLLFTLINCEYKISKHKERLTYVSQIWSTKEGFALTFQPYDKKTLKPI